jgi:hypothetical protein
VSKNKNKPKRKPNKNQKPDKTKEKSKNQKVCLPLSFFYTKINQKSKVREKTREK